MSLTKILSFLKLKGVEITAEEAAALADQTSISTPQIQQLSDTDFKHNKKLFEEMQQQFAEQMKQQQDMFKAEMEGYKKQNEDLVTLLGQERQAREEGQKALQEKLEKDRNEKVTQLIEKAIAEQRIPAQNDELKQTYLKMASADYEGTEKILSNLPGIATPPATPQKVGNETKPGTLDRAVASTALPHFVNLVEEGFAKIDSN